MADQIIEVAGNGRHLAVQRGFITIRAEGEILTRVALDDLIAVIVSGHGCTHSSNLLCALAERGIPMAICGANQTPQAWVLPMEGHHAQSARMQAQAAAKLPLKKRIWQQVVRKKICNQAQALDILEKSGGKGLLFLARKVQSGDVGNIEAQAARRYWQLLFGKDFTRNRNSDGINAMLNYGYAIIRSCVARGIVAAGLHPTLGIHHYGPTNSMCLVDDLMEPCRPLVDCAVKILADRKITELTPKSKSALASLVILDLPGPFGVTTLFTATTRMSLSLAQIFQGEKKRLELMEMPDPLVLQSIVPAIHDD